MENYKPSFPSSVRTTPPAPLNNFNLQLQRSAAETPLTHHAGCMTGSGNGTRLAVFAVCVCVCTCKYLWGTSSVRLPRLTTPSQMSKMVEIGVGEPWTS